MYKNLAIILLSTFLLIGCNEKPKNEVKKEVLKEVKVLTIEKKNHAIWIDFSGKTEAFVNVNINARVQGTLEKQFFKPGDYVNENDTLFHIEDTDYKASVKQAQAQLAQDKASLKLATSKYNRYKPLVEQELVSKEQLDELIAQKESTEAVLQAGYASLKKAKLNLSYTNVKATISGYIGKGLINTGNMVGTDSSNMTLANIVQTKKLYINFNPGSGIVQTIQKYKSEEQPKVVIEIPNSQHIQVPKFEGIIDFIDNKTDESTGTVQMRAVVQNKDNLLLPGTFVNIKLFITDQIPMIAVSSNLILQNQLGSYVLVVDNENKVKTRQLKIEFSNIDLSIIKEGLDIGDKVITSPTKNLKNNMQVTFTTKTQQ